MWGKIIKKFLGNYDDIFANFKKILKMFSRAFLVADM